LIDIWRQFPPLIRSHSLNFTRQQGEGYNILSLITSLLIALDNFKGDVNLGQSGLGKKLKSYMAGPKGLAVFNTFKNIHNILEAQGGLF
jgi:hypothetical protein